MKRVTKIGMLIAFGLATVSLFAGLTLHSLGRSSDLAILLSINLTSVLVCLGFLFLIVYVFNYSLPLQRGRSMAAKVAIALLLCAAAYGVLILLFDLLPA